MKQRRPHIARQATPGSVVTFYSYKGGVGRTMALADTAVVLSRWGYRVLCLDWDLEAPGLDAFFARWIGKKRPSPGLLDLIESHGKSGFSRRWQEVVQSIPLEKARKPLALITAGSQDDEYMHRVQSLDWDRLYEAGFGRSLETIRSEWIREYDFVFVDSRTGASDTGGICTIQLPEVLVVLFTPTDQSVEGVRRIAARAQERQAKLPLDRGRLLVVPVPTRVDATEHKLRETWQRRIETRLGHFISEWSGEERDLAPRVLRQLTVPYVPYWSYGEELPAIAESPRDRMGLREAHETLAALLAQQLSAVVDLVSNRDSFVRRAQAGPLQGEGSFDVFLSHDRSDKEFARRLAEFLQQRGVRVWRADEQVHLGEPMDERLAEAIREAASVVILIGHRFGEWQRFELEEAVKAGISGQKRILPVLLKGVDRSAAPSILNSLNLLKQDLRQGDTRLFEELAREIRMAGQGIPRGQSDGTSAGLLETTGTPGHSRQRTSSERTTRSKKRRATKKATKRRR